MKHAVMLRSLGYRHDVFEPGNRRETLQIHASLYAQHTVHIISNRVLSLGLIPAVFRKVFSIRCVRWRSSLHRRCPHPVAGPGIRHGVGPRDRARNRGWPRNIERLCEPEPGYFRNLYKMLPPGYMSTDATSPGQIGFHRTKRLHQCGLDTRRLGCEAEKQSVGR